MFPSGPTSTASSSNDDNTGSLTSKGASDQSSAPPPGPPPTPSNDDSTNVPASGYAETSETPHSTHHTNDSSSSAVPASNVSVDATEDEDSSMGPGSPIQVLAAVIGSSRMLDDKVFSFKSTPGPMRRITSSPFHHYDPKSLDILKLTSEKSNEDEIRLAETRSNILDEFKEPAAVPNAIVPSISEILAQEKVDELESSSESDEDAMGEINDGDEHREDQDMELEIDELEESDEDIETDSDSMSVTLVSDDYSDDDSYMYRQATPYFLPYANSSDTIDDVIDLTYPSPEDWSFDYNTSPSPVISSIDSNDIYSPTEHSLPIRNPIDEASAIADANDFVNGVEKRDDKSLASANVDIVTPPIIAKTALIVPAISRLIEAEKTANEDMFPKTDNLLVPRAHYCHAVTPIPIDSRLFELKTDELDWWDYEDAELITIRAHEAVYVAETTPRVHVPPPPPGHPLWALKNNLPIYRHRLSVIYEGVCDNHPLTTFSNTIIDLKTPGFEPWSREELRIGAPFLCASLLIDDKELSMEDWHGVTEDWKEKEIRDRIYEEKQRRHPDKFPTYRAPSPILPLSNIINIVKEPHTSIVEHSILFAQSAISSGSVSVVREPKFGAPLPSYYVRAYHNPYENDNADINLNPWNPRIVQLRQIRAEIVDGIRRTAKYLLLPKWRDVIDALDADSDVRHFFYSHCYLFRLLAPNAMLGNQGFSVDCVHLNRSSNQQLPRKPLTTANALITHYEDEFLAQAARIFEIKGRSELVNSIRHVCAAQVFLSAEARLLFEEGYLDPIAQWDRFGNKRPMIWEEMTKEELEEGLAIEMAERL